MTGDDDLEMIKSIHKDTDYNGLRDRKPKQRDFATFKLLLKTAEIEKGDENNEKSDNKLEDEGKISYLIKHNR